MGTGQIHGEQDCQQPFGHDSYIDSEEVIPADKQMPGAKNKEQLPRSLRLANWGMGGAGEGGNRRLAWPGL